MPRDSRLTQPFAILVVDDDDDVRDLLAEYLRDQGYDVGAASDGRAAIAAIEREPTRYNVIITDLQMPGADGLAVLRAARAHNASCYVVIVTGYASLDSAIQAVRLGAHDYLTKPFSIGQIDVILRRVAERLALEAENRQLTRQLESQAADGPERAGTVRLDDLDARLRRIEGLLVELTDRDRRRSGER